MQNDSGERVGFSILQFSLAASSGGTLNMQDQE